VCLFRGRRGRAPDWFTDQEDDTGRDEEKETEGGAQTHGGHLD